MSILIIDLDFEVLTGYAENHLGIEYLLKK